MYIYVTIEEVTEQDMISAMLAKRNIEKDTGQPCMIINFKKLSANLIENIKPRGVIISGIGSDLQTFDKEEFRELNNILKNIDMPFLCICGSHQLLAEVYNKNIDEVDKFYHHPMRKLAATDNGPLYPGDRAEYFITNGFYKIKKEKDDPIFEGLGDDIHMRCVHYCEVKELPPDFVVLASSEHCKIEAMKHKEKCLYGVQFHTEAYKEPYTDGATILRNFANIADNFWKDR